jgi:hypothetical protein
LTFEITVRAERAKRAGDKMPTFTISQIEEAINFWRGRQAAGEDAALCPKARSLADIYGKMIYQRADTVEVAALTPEQVDAITMALYQRDLPL